MAEIKASVWLLWGNGICCFYSVLAVQLGVGSQVCLLAAAVSFLLVAVPFVFIYMFT